MKTNDKEAANQTGKAASKFKPADGMGSGNSKITALIVGLFLMLYVPSFFIWAFGQDIKTDILRPISVEDIIHTDAYLIREEEVITSPITGRCLLTKSEGEKVSGDSHIATVYKDSSEETLNKIQQLEESILQAQKSKNENDVLFHNDILKLDGMIFQEIRKITSYAETGSYVKIADVKSEMDDIIRKKATITGNLSTSDTYIQGLKKQRDSLQSSLESTRRDIFNKQSGVISYSLDGLEKELSFQSIPRLTLKELERLNPVQEPRKQVNIVQAGQPVAKVINNLEAYLVVVLDAVQSEELAVDSNVRIKLNDLGDKTITGTVDYISQEEGGKTITAIKVNKGIDDTTRFRKLSIDIIKSTKSGYRVPVSALKNIRSDGGENVKAQILTVRFNYSELQDVQVAMMNKEFAVVNSPEDSSLPSISIYDEYVVNAEKISEGRRVK